MTPESDSAQAGMPKEIHEFMETAEKTPWTEDKFEAKEVSTINAGISAIDSLKAFQLRPGTFEAFAITIKALNEADRKVEMVIDERLAAIRDSYERTLKDPWASQSERDKLFRELMQNRIQSTMVSMMKSDRTEFAFGKLLNVMLDMSSTLEKEHPDAFQSLFNRHAYVGDDAIASVPRAAAETSEEPALPLHESPMQQEMVKTAESKTIRDQVIAMALEGKNNSEIAAALGKDTKNITRVLFWARKQGLLVPKLMV